MGKMKASDIDLQNAGRDSESDFLERMKATYISWPTNRLRKEVDNFLAELDNLSWTESQCMRLAQNELDARTRRREQIFGKQLAEGSNPKPSKTGLKGDNISPGPTQFSTLIDAMPDSWEASRQLAERLKRERGTS